MAHASKEGRPAVPRTWVSGEISGIPIPLMQCFLFHAESFDHDKRARMFVKPGLERRMPCPTPLVPRSKPRLILAR